MALVTELTLPQIDITDQAFADNPFPPYEAALKKHWLAQTPAGYMVLNFEDMRDILSMDDKLDTPNKAVTELMGAGETRWGKWNDRFLLAKNGNDHRRIRDLVAMTFTPRNAEAHRPVMEETVNALLDEWAVKEEFDFNDFSSNFPIRVMCRLIGANPDDVPKIKDALEAMGNGFSLDPSILPSLEAAHTCMWDFVDELFKEREANSKSADEEKDLLDQLLDATHAENGLTREELYDLIILLFGGGYDTSKNALNVITNLMLDRPDDWARLQSDNTFAKAVLNEMLRYSSVVTTYRIPREDLTHKNVTIPAGTMLIFPTPLAGHDSSVFSNAATFDPERKPEQRHFAFGRGIHNCLGQHIARVQIEVALPLIAARMPNLSRNGEPTWRPFPGIWGLQTLPVKTN